MATTTADPLDVITHAQGGVPRHVTIVSAVAGFYSVDGGHAWDRIEANARQTRYDLGSIKSVKIKRDGATDMTGVYTSVWG